MSLNTMEVITNLRNKFSTVFFYVGEAEMATSPNRAQLHKK